MALSIFGIPDRKVACRMVWVSYSSTQELGQDYDCIKQKMNVKITCIRKPGKQSETTKEHRDADPKGDYNESILSGFLMNQIVSNLIINGGKGYLFDVIVLKPK